MRMSEAARVLGAELRGAPACADPEFTGVSTDSRTLARGDLFVALKGERFDGHAYLPAVAAAGAAGAIVSRGVTDPACPVLVVDDPQHALTALARHWRGRFTGVVTALTGSSGKTTVKDMLAAILRAHAGDTAVLATEGNLNNHIGVPLTLLKLRANHRYAVVELGMNHAGEIRDLTALAAPEVGLVTNAGTAHIEFLGSREAIARAKGELFEGLKADATAVVNADDAFAPLWRELAGARPRIEFSLECAADVRASYALRGLDSEIRLTTPLGTAPAVVPAPGLHNVKNALAASAAAAALKLAPEIIATGLARFVGARGRLQRRRAPGGAMVIDDTYNANPESMRAAIAVLAALPAPRVLVLGDMGELGGDGPALHAEIGACAREAGIEILYALGVLSTHTVRAFGPGARHFASLDELLAALRGTAGAGASVLVKGSRFMRMERVVAALTGEAAGPH
jgi:UDP-N-acetylmuramoyl-tripeptide--D-alanyl-D-alanine ligase